MSMFTNPPAGRPLSLLGAPFIVAQMLGAPFIVAQMKYDVMKAARSLSLASADDPLVRYIRNNRRLNLRELAYERLQISAYLILCVRTKTALTIGQGAANVIATPPQSEPDPRDPHTKSIKWLAKHLRRLREQNTKHPEEITRRKEFDQKMLEAQSSLFGDYVNEMWSVDNLGVDPSKQGRGYGGGLLRSVTWLADLAGKTTWVRSSNIANTPFYNKHGFFTVDTFIVGEHNPTWDGRPVVVSIMIREPTFTNMRSTETL